MKLETTDILETVTGSPSDQKAIKEEENKQKEKEEKMETQTLLIQQVEKLKKRIFQINFLFFLVNFNIRNNRN